jgi:hypothetical protein
VGVIDELVTSENVNEGQRVIWSIIWSIRREGLGACGKNKFARG